MDFLFPSLDASNAGRMPAATVQSSGIQSKIFAENADELTVAPADESASIDVELEELEDEDEAVGVAAGGAAGGGGVS